AALPIGEDEDSEHDCEGTKRLHWRNHLRTTHWSTSSRRLGTPITGAEAGLILASGAYSKSLIEPALAADRSEHSIRGTVSRHKQQTTAIGLHDVSASLRTAGG